MPRSQKELEKALILLINAPADSISAKAVLMRCWGIHCLSHQHQRRALLVRPCERWPFRGGCGGEAKQLADPLPAPGSPLPEQPRGPLRTGRGAPGGWWRHSSGAFSVRRATSPFPSSFPAELGRALHQRPGAGSPGCTYVTAEEAESSQLPSSSSVICAGSLLPLGHLGDPRKKKKKKKVVQGLPLWCSG